MTQKTPAGGHRTGEEQWTTDTLSNSSHRLYPVVLRQLETSIVGAALNHVDECLTVRKHVDPKDIRSPKFRAILEVLYDLEPTGLLETPRSTLQIVADVLHERGAGVSLFDLVEVSEAGAIGGTHLDRQIRAWRKTLETIAIARDLEEKAARARRGLA